MASPPASASPPPLPVTPAAPAASKKRRRAPPAAAPAHPEAGGSGAGDDDDGAIDDLLEALGIPDSDKKRRQQRAAEVIELLTPPRTSRSVALQSVSATPLAAVGDVLELDDSADDQPPPAAHAPAVAANGENRRRSLVDLTSPDRSDERSGLPAASTLSVAPSPSSSPKVASQHARSPPPPAASEREDAPRAPPSPPSPAAPAPLSQPVERELQLTPGTPTSDQECDAMLDDLLFTRPLAERIAAARGQAAASGVDTSATGSSTTNASAAAITAASLQQETASRPIVRAAAAAAPGTPQRRTSATTSSAPGAQRRGSVLVLVRMERTLDASEAGRAIRTALQTHVHNKPLAAEVETPFECALANVIRWERRERAAPAAVASRRPRSGAGGSSSSATPAAPATVCGLLAAAIYFHADAFVQLLQLQSYSEVLRLVRSLKSEVRARADRMREQQSRHVEIQTSTFVVVEGMDKCLIKLKKKRKSTSASQAPSTLAFSDIHEMAFQLFMDTETHTQFTVDLEDTAAYVAMATREMVLAAAKKSPQEDLLESAPRLHSFRVTASGATTNAFANAWLRMLQLVPGVSEDKAQSVLDHFPTFASLLLAYSDPSLSREAKEDLLASRLVGRGLGRALSRRIFNVFCVDNPDALI